MAGEAGKGFEEAGAYHVGEYLLQGYVHQWHGLGNYSMERMVRWWMVGGYGKIRSIILILKRMKSKKIISLL